ncbi:uncharacterized protein LOC116207170 [Punica granatum]|uniref:Wound-responsive family protein n=2 Tax=Punica granatum TaxID=22663 RepID=A0A218WXN5_PUNGR|nr:uncharacterized protein LOC116207170 [Punica granatum]OWM77557.1 hypothetical protein CDL15_Pgr016955 [Punica granatum]PKI58524.1 hypothetical protein CRG98_021085 [Punica granatum]
MGGGRALYQAAVRALQGMRDQASRCDSNVKKVQQARRFSSTSSGLDSVALRAAKIERERRAEEPLRTVMFLSCWGPN